MQDPIITPIIINVGLEVGISVGTGAAIASVATPALLLGGAIGLQYALAPKPPSIDPPKPENGHASTRQPITSRASGYGTNRMALGYMLYEEKNGVSWDIIAWHAGKAGAAIGYFLHEDRVTLHDDGFVTGLSDGRFSGNLVQIKTTLGLAAETAFADVVSALPEIWTTDHRGDGVAAAMLKCQSPSSENYLQRFPSGKPEPSIEGNLLNVWDPRDPAQDPDDPTTWTDYPAFDIATTYAADARVTDQGAVYYSRNAGNLGNTPALNPESWCRVETNPVLQTIDYLLDTTHGMGLDRAMLITPSLARLIEEANICDELVATKDGTQEPRYSSEGFFNWDNDPAATLGQIMSTCDGWYSEQFDGSLALWVGKYRAPTVTLSDRHITGYSFTDGKVDEESVNEILLTFTSVAAKYKTVQGAGLRNEADITLKGKARSKTLDLSWVRKHSQARRLQKRAMARETNAQTGTLSTKLYALKADGQRWISVQYSQYPDLNDAVVELQPGGSFDLMNGRGNLAFQIIDPATVDAWDPATEEGDAPPVPDELDGNGMPVPAGVSASMQGDATNGLHILASCDDPSRADLTYSLRYRLQDDGSGSPGPWITLGISNPTISGGRVDLTTGIVQSSATFEVEIAFIGGGGTLGDYSAAATVDSNTGAPASATDVAVTRGSDNTVTWQNPNSGNFYKSVVYRATVSIGDPAPVFADTTAVFTQFAAPSSSGTYIDPSSPSGADYYYWVVAENAGGEQATPDGPAMVSVP